MSEAHEALQQEIITCTRCPRLTAWCRQIAAEKVKRFAEDTYWGKPVPSFGSPDARLVIIGLAPAAHGANRTGRMFTGDKSGDWLYRAMHKAGFATQPTSVHKDDGLALIDAYITATAHCAPPDNKPTREEIEACADYLHRELPLLPNARVLIALGKVGYDNLLKALPIAWGETLPKPKPAFGHGAEIPLPSGRVILCSFHPSQQNTFTGKLTEPMFDAVFTRARALLST